TESYELPGCRCGEVITGKCDPADCGLFGVQCTPRDPMGPCMVSSEGACAAAYKYERR
ncbi:MAG: hydrogenase formation protein HypD, partial [Planctomycetota bacterium]